MSKLTTVIWDFNGTLVDDAAACLEATNYMLGQRGLAPVEQEAYRRLFRFPVIDYYRDIGFAVDDGQYDALADEFLELYRQRCHLCGLQPGVDRALELLSQAGVRQIVLSASESTILGRQLADLGILGYFDQVLGVDNARAGGKVELAKAWMAQSGLEPGSVLLIGDTTHDAEAAAAIGVPCLLVPSGHHDAARLAAMGARIVENSQNLPAILAEYL